MFLNYVEHLENETESLKSAESILSSSGKLAGILTSIKHSAIQHARSDTDKTPKLPTS